MGYLKTSLTVLIVSLTIVLATPARADDTHTVTTIVEGGNGQIRPPSPVVRDGKRTTLTMKPDRGWHVAEITLDGTITLYDKDDVIALTGVRVAGKTVRYTLEDVTADYRVAVTFEPDRTYTLTFAVDGNGTVQARPAGATCTQETGPCVVTYTEDRHIKLRAKPGRGQLFTGWTGGTSGIRKQSTLVMNGNKTVTARFEPRSAAVSALQVADKISVVDAKEGAVGAALRVPAVPAESDYERDKTFTFVEERSVEAFETINEILCMAAQTRYDALLNVGPYTALVDENQCAKDKDDAASADGADAQSSGSSRPEYMHWTVDSSRRDNGAPHVVRVWVREEGENGYDHEEPSKMIFAKLVITESAGAANPYGVFALNFEAYPMELGGAAHGGAVRSGGLAGQPLFKGYLKTDRDAAGDVLLKFISSGEGGPEHFTQKATLNRNETGGRGTTSVHSEFGSGVEDKTYDIAFSDAYFLRDDGTERLCLDRNNFDESAWRYALYDAVTGSRINPRSGFPVKVTQNGRDHYGWIGYWGMWFSEDVVLENGDTVYKLGSDDEEGEPFQLFRAQGKLRKHTKRVATLGEIMNVPLDWWDDTAQGNHRLNWNGTDFMKVASFDEATGTWAEVQPAEVLPLTGLRHDTMSFWSQALGGNVRVKLDCTPTTPSDPGQPPSFDCSADDDSIVILYTETIVYPSDTVPVSLACMAQCPNGANDGSETVYFDDAALQYQNTAPASAAYIGYTFNGDTMLLMHGATQIIQTGDNAYHPWGVRSGPLFEPTSTNLAQLACEWDQTGQTTCGWQASATLDEYYTWESGPDDWNTLTALQNGHGELERFEPPLSVQYAHAQSDPTAPDHKYDGTTFHLQYNGFGNLHGIPGRCVDRTTGAGTSCGPQTRWIPELTIPDGSTMQGDAATYLSKALEKEQRMRSVDLASCSSLHLVSYDLPKIDEWRSPDIGNEPAVEGPPAVVGGVIQE